MKRKVNCGHLSVEITLLGLPHIVKVASEKWPNLRVSVERLTSCQIWISRSPVTARIIFLFDYLNQKMITAINTFDSFKLGDHQIRF